MVSSSNSTFKFVSHRIGCKIILIHDNSTDFQIRYKLFEKMELKGPDDLSTSFLYVLLSQDSNCTNDILI